MRFMATLLSKVIDNLTEEIHKIKYKCLSCNKEYSNRPNEELKKKYD